MLATLNFGKGIKLELGVVGSRDTKVGKKMTY
jgi:hypothetical protein